MFPGTLPKRFACLTIVLKNPCSMLAVDGLVKTFRPWALAIATSILVVVDFPAVPVTTTSPFSKEFRVL